MSPLIRRHHHQPARWQLTPWGWVLTVAVPALAIVAVADPSRGVIVALIAMVLLWAILLGASFPSSRSMNTFDRGRDYGRDAAEEWERRRGRRG